MTASTRTLAAALAALVLSPAAALAQVDEARLKDEAVERVREYLRIDTTNPPGNETRGAEFFARIFEAEGIPYEIAESAPGRGNIWARLEGGDAPALVLLHHMDVVPADPAYWEVAPLSGELRDGHIWGRGALDTKTLGILQLQAFLALHRAGEPLDRDVLFMATADEEAGGFYGAGWLVENRPELFEGVGLLLNEGGGGGEFEGRPIFEVEVTQKVPVWLRLTARGTPGHGSTPRVETAVTRLVRALDNVRRHRFEARLIPAVEAYLRGRGEAGIGPLAEAMKDPASLVADPDLLLALQLAAPGLHAILRNTCSLTRLEGSSKINVVPPEAAAELDCRLLPDQDQEVFLEELRTVINDPAVEIETLMAFSPAVSATDTELYRAIVGVVGERFPGAPVLPAVLTGFTDSHFFRDLGIASYGFSPLVVPAEDDAGVHGNNERISVENIRRGTEMMLEIVRRVVHARRTS